MSSQKVKTENTVPHHQLLIHEGHGRPSVNEKPNGASWARIISWAQNRYGEKRVKKSI
uniref:Uncharacterized protein n=1 Tax=Cryptococcus bacillisporus CA1280 TaxID=1296109 RepID=A0A0D0VGI8_CRYGA|nr:hypothetical protein I312_06828 [Cryptococcus bacillisporus CA1280]